MTHDKPSIEDALSELIEAAQYSGQCVCPENECEHVQEVRAAREALRSRFLEQQADAERIAWLAENYFAADFRYGDPDNPIQAIVIRIPEFARVSSDFVETIDRLRVSPRSR